MAKGNKNPKPVEEVTEEVTEEVKDVVEETRTAQGVTPSDSVEEETPNKEEGEKNSNTFVGTVFGTLRLKLRARPTNAKDAAPLRIVHKDDDVLVDLDKSTENFYHCTHNLNGHIEEGFMNKKYIQKSED